MTTRGRRAARLAVQIGLLSGGAALAVMGPFASASFASARYAEHVSVDSSQASGASTEAWLAAGVRYHFTVTGTYSFGAGEDADAKCSTGDGFTWSADRYGSGALHLTVNGVVVDWAPQTSDVFGCDTFGHTYAASYTPFLDGPATLAVEAGPGAQSDYAGVLEVDVTGSAVAAPPSDSTEPAPAAPSNNDSSPPTTAPSTAPSDDNSAPATNADDAPASGPADTSPAPAADGPRIRIVRTPVVPPRTSTAPTGVAAPTSPAAPSAPTAPSGDHQDNSLESFMLSDQPKAAARPENQVVLQTARPSGRGFQAPSPLILVPLVVGVVILLRPRQTLAFTFGVVRKVPARGRAHASTAPWRVEVESAPPPLPIVPSAMERPVLSGGTPAATSRKVRIRRRTW